jgi:hypothetical protein
LTALCLKTLHDNQTPHGQKKPEGHTQLDCVWFEQSDEYDPAAQA